MSTLRTRSAPFGFLILAALSLARSATAGDYRTPRAGEGATGTIFGREVRAPERDRNRITYLNLGAVLLADGPDGLSIGPMGGVYVWRVDPRGESRFRAALSGLANELRWDHAVGDPSTLSVVFTFDSLTLPWTRSEYVQGARIRSEELEWLNLRMGIGLAYRKAIAPWACDNGLDVALTLEPGDLKFWKGSHTDPAYVLPSDTFEARLHLRARVDALERNIVELPHRGWSFGVDLVGGRRSRWEPWGLRSHGTLEAQGRSWGTVTAFAFAALPPFPGLSERHRLVASLHAGIGGDLDRFSALRLGSGSTWGDFETLSRAVLPAAGVDEIATSRYAILDLEYRYELLFFLYLQLRGTLAWTDRPVREGHELVTRTGSFPAVTAGLTTGLPWNLSMELAGSWGFGLERMEEGGAEKGRAGFLVSLTKEF